MLTDTHSPSSRAKREQGKKPPLGRMGRSRQSQGQGPLNSISAWSFLCSCLPGGLSWRLNKVRVTLRYLAMCKWLSLGTNRSEQMLVINYQQALLVLARWMPALKQNNVKMSSCYLTHRDGVWLMLISYPASQLPFEQTPVKAKKQLQEDIASDNQTSQVYYFMAMGY